MYNVDNLINSIIQSANLKLRARDTCLKQATEAFLLAPTQKLSDSEVAEALVAISQGIVQEHNANLIGTDKALKWKMPDDLTHTQVGMCIASRNHVIKLSYTDVILECVYAVYDEASGLYVTDDSLIISLIQGYVAGADNKFIANVFTHLDGAVPKRTRTLERDLIPVNNGIYNYKTKQLIDYSPDYVFVTKSRTNYNPNAQNIIIHNDEDGTDWDVESWMAELTDDPEITQLLWEVTGAILRPNVAWDKAAWLYSDRGENGKGTLCAMWNNLCGDAATSIPIADFAKDFMLSSLIKAQAIIVDENDVGAFIDKAGILKAVITNDPISINRKFKDPVKYQFHGFMVQCLNELPRFKDKSDSVYRRQLFVPMSKCFTGKARKYIKADYIHRPEVLEYVMKRVFDMDYYELSEPASCKAVLDEYKAFNDPVRQFWSEFEEEFVWDMLPNGFLYDLYKSWFARTNPSGSLISRTIFVKDVRNVAIQTGRWASTNDKEAVKGRMDDTEPLIYHYNLEGWMASGYNVRSQATIDAICRFHVCDSYRGLVRLDSSVN